MNKFLRLLKWPLYYMATKNERELYVIGKIRGYRVTHITHRFTGMDVYGDRDKEPERNYETFKEFMNPPPPCEHESIEYNGAYDEWLKEIGQERLVLECRKCGATYHNPTRPNNN